MMCMVTISVSRCKSLRLCLVFFNFNIPLLLMFDKNILLVFNIIKHYLRIDYIALIFFVLYVSCHHSLGATGATLNTRNASS